MKKLSFVLLLCAILSQSLIHAQTQTTTVTNDAKQKVWVFFTVRPKGHELGCRGVHGTRLPFKTGPSIFRQICYRKLLEPGQSASYTWASYLPRGKSIKIYNPRSKKRYTTYYPNLTSQYTWTDKKPKEIMMHNRGGWEKVTKYSNAFVEEYADRL